jgi:hypothetical protein
MLEVTRTAGFSKSHLKEKRIVLIIVGKKNYWLCLHRLLAPGAS